LLTGRRNSQRGFRKRPLGFPVAVSSITPKGNTDTPGKVYLKDVQMGMIILTTEVTLPEDKIRADFRVELRKTLGQPA
jgi:hypothetical protein